MDAVFIKNLFSRLRPSLRKWKEGTRLLVLKALGALLAFAACVYLIFQFAHVDTLENYMQIERYDRTTGIRLKERPDTFIVRFANYYTHTSNVLHAEGGSTIRLVMHEDTTATILHDRQRDAAIDSIFKALPDSSRLQMQTEHWRDSLCLIYQMRFSTKQLHLPIFTDIFDGDTIVQGAWAGRYDSESFYIHFKGKEEDSRLKLEHQDIVAFFKGFWREGRGTLNNTMDFSLDYFYFLREGDLSQSYYTLKFPHAEKDSSAYYSITRLEIDLGGPTRFVGLSPAPDEATLSGIVYDDPAKLRKIFSRQELTFFCQFPETSNIQTVRTYLVSTIATFFLGVLLKLLFEIVCRLRPLPPLRRCRQGCRRAAARLASRMARLTSRFARR